MNERILIIFGALLLLFIAFLWGAYELSLTCEERAFEECRRGISGGTVEQCGKIAVDLCTRAKP